MGCPFRLLNTLTLRNFCIAFCPLAYRLGESLYNCVEQPVVFASIVFTVLASVPARRRSG